MHIPDEFWAAVAACLAVLWRLLWLPWPEGSGRIWRNAARVLINIFLWFSLRDLLALEPPETSERDQLK